MYSYLFSPITVGGKRLGNRIVMAPLYLGYAGAGGVVSPLMREHYRLMAESGVSIVVVENATVDHPIGSGAGRTLRIDTDNMLDDLAALAFDIKKHGALACIQINHAGRFAAVESPVAPSEVETFGKMPKALSFDELLDIREKFAAAARRAVDAGFDMVELHGGTGYLLSEFVSPRTNKRTDKFGGNLADRMKFPLSVLSAVKAEVGGFPVGYRFLADEYLPDGLKLEESVEFAESLVRSGAAYLSVMGGTYESFALPEIIERSKTEAYMADLAAAVKKHVEVPVIAAGRIATGAVAENILKKGQADLVGLARVLWADPEWPQKVRESREKEIVPCDPECGDVCMKLLMEGKPAFCQQWSSEKTRRFKDLFE